MAETLAATDTGLSERTYLINRLAKYSTASERLSAQKAKAATDVSFVPENLSSRRWRRPHGP